MKDVRSKKETIAQARACQRQARTVSSSTVRRDTEGRIDTKLSKDQKTQRQPRCVRAGDVERIIVPYYNTVHVGIIVPYYNTVHVVIRQDA